MAAVDPNFRVKGTIAAPLTSFTQDGELDLSDMPTYVRFLDTHDIDGVFILGTMGEGMSLTVEERKKIAEEWVKATKTTQRLKTVVVHIGTGNLKESMELAQHAEKIGANAIACMSPNYNKPKDEEALVKYMKKVAAEAPKTPFYLYDINFMTGVYLNTARFLELATGQIPTLRGAKVSSRELPALTDCTYAVGGRYQIMIGTDEQMLTALALGVDVPVLNGFLGGIFTRLKAAFDAKDFDTARKEQILARKLVLERGRYGGGPPMVKSIMRCLGVDIGHVRLPLTDLTSEQEKNLRQDLIDIGFIEK
ncbi:N-acetylneuraminate lyase-like [Littorina saxatilis]|uniref:N-acetylneuraminate lyase n=1 Tax=Littorina saxatilis TaxID=31220 RepID=A0AAN9GL34_9CAEN